MSTESSQIRWPCHVVAFREHDHKREKGGRTHKVLLHLLLQHPGHENAPLLRALR